MDDLTIADFTPSAGEHLRFCPVPLCLLVIDTEANADAAGQRWLGHQDTKAYFHGA